MIVRSESTPQVMSNYCFELEPKQTALTESAPITHKSSDKLKLILISIGRLCSLDLLIEYTAIKLVAAVVNP